MEKLKELEMLADEAIASSIYSLKVKVSDILAIVEAFRELEKRAEAAEEALETEYKWRDLALQFDGHRMQALSLLKMIVNDAPVEQYQPVRNFLNSPPLSGEDIMKERIAAIAGRPAPAINLTELVPGELTHDGAVKMFAGLPVTATDVWNACRGEMLRKIEEKVK